MEEKPLPEIVRRRPPRVLPPLWLRALMVGWNSYMYTSPSGDSCGAASANARSSVVEWYRGRADRAAIHRKEDSQ